MSASQDPEKKLRLPASTNRSSVGGSEIQAGKANGDASDWQQDKTFPTGQWQSRPKERKAEQNASYPSIQAGPFLTRQIVGSYRIINFLGQGGMGFVYRVEHTIMQKELALKVLRQRGPANEWRRFQTEAQAIARLDHPNIVKIYDMNQTDDGMPYYTMDLLLGQSLADYIVSRTYLPLAEALPIFRQVASGLAYAHDHGIIHRDIKPANIMLLAGKAQSPNERATPVVKIVDFGIAKLTNQDNEVQGVTKPGEIFGSPIYMSPEQCSGQKVDFHTDMYSLGVTFYEALTGKPPFVGRTAVETTAMHQTKMAPSLSEGLKGTVFPEAIEDIVARLLAKNPQRRYQSLAEMAHELLQLERGPKAVALTSEAPASNQSAKALAKTLQEEDFGQSGIRSKATPPAEAEAALKQFTGWKYSKRGDQFTAARHRADTAPQAVSADNTAEFDSEQDDENDLILGNSAVRRPNRTTVRSAGPSANEAGAKQEKLIWLTVGIMIAFGIISAAGIYIFVQSSQKSHSGNIVGTLGMEKITTKFKASDEAKLEESLGGPENDRPETPAEKAAVAAALQDKKPYSIRITDHGQVKRLFNFPGSIDFGSLCWIKHDSVMASGKVLIPENSRVKFDASIVVARHCELLRRFRPDDIGWYCQAHSPQGPTNILSELTSLAQLEKLSLKGATIKDDQLRHLDKLSKLDFLCLNGCRFNQKALAATKTVGRIVGMEITDSLDDSLIQALSKNPNLLALQLININIDRSKAAAIAKLSNLRELQIESCNLGPGVFEELSALPKLKILKVLKSHDTNPVALSPLQNLKSLRYLQFDFMKSKPDAKEGVFSNPSWKPDEITALRRLIPNARIFNHTDETEWPALNQVRENSGRSRVRGPFETPN
jgi:serine/threonine protein kinase